MKIVYGAICRNHRIRLNATMRNDQFEVEKNFVQRICKSTFRDPGVRAKDWKQRELTSRPRVAPSCSNGGLLSIG